VLVVVVVAVLGDAVDAGDVVWLMPGLEHDALQ